ncbi:hypothetical protein GCM10027578_15200 [Spirosoma luteolum]
MAGRVAAAREAVCNGSLVAGAEELLQPQVRASRKTSTSGFIEVSNVNQTNKPKLGAPNGGSPGLG